MVGNTRHPVLIGEYELTLDDKKRLLVPAEVRRAIPAEYGEAFYLVLGTNRVPWLWPARFYEDLVMQVPSDMIPGDDTLAFDQLLFGMASKIECDKQGRVLIADRILKRGGIEKDVTLVGVRDHLELWGRNAWEARRNELEARAPEIYSRARLARQYTTPQPVATQMARPAGM